MYKNWIEFKKSFSEEQQKCLMQYFYDHSRLQKNGYWGILFYFKDDNDFWSRLYARYTGKYKRYEIASKEEKHNHYWYFQKISEKNQKITQRIEKSGSLFEKIILYIYRKTRDYLFIRNN